MARCVERERKKGGGSQKANFKMSIQNGDLCIYIYINLYIQYTLTMATHSVWHRCVNGSISLCVYSHMVILSEYFSVELGATRVLINFLQMINECFLISIPALEKDLLIYNKP